MQVEQTKCSQCNVEDVPAGGTVVVCEDCEKTYTVLEKEILSEEDDCKQKGETQTQTPVPPMAKTKEKLFNCCCQKWTASTKVSALHPRCLVGCVAQLLAILSAECAE